MTTDEMKNKIKTVVCTGMSYGITVFACLKSDEGINLKKFLVTDELHSNLKSILDNALSSKYLADGVELEPSENIADGSSVLYEVVQTEKYCPFTFLNNVDTVEGQYSEEDQTNLTGWIFRLNLNDNTFCIYQHIYPMRLINRSKSLFAMLSHNKTYKTLDRDVLKIDSRADILIVGNSLITSNIPLLQNTFGFERYIRAEAAKTIAAIEAIDLVEGIDKFLAFENKEKLTNAKKLMKAKNSPVLNIPRDELLRRIKVHGRYKDKFIIENEKIHIKSQKDANEFVKMLNDDIVRSELTNQEYDSIRKMLLEPLK